MANYATLKAAIQAVIYENGNQEITGSVMQATLLAMVNSLGANYQYAGIATPSTNPGTPDQNVFYLASTAGTYVNFGNIVLAENEVAILKYNGSWVKEASGFASAEKVNQLDQELNGVSQTEEVTIPTTSGSPIPSQTRYDVSLVAGRPYSIHWDKGTSGITSQPFIYFYNANGTRLTDYTKNGNASATYEALSLNTDDVFVFQTAPAKVSLYVAASNVPNTGAGKLTISNERPGLIDNVLLGWIISESFTVTSASYTDGVVNSPVAVLWPDGMTGTLAIVRDSDGNVTSITATHGTDSIVLSVTRDTDGNVISSEIN